MALPGAVAVEHTGAVRDMHAPVGPLGLVAAGLVGANWGISGHDGGGREKKKLREPNFI
jgi:hypothetical protein